MFLASAVYERLVFAACTLGDLRARVAEFPDRLFQWQIYEILALVKSLNIFKRTSSKKASTKINMTVHPEGAQVVFHPEREEKQISVVFVRKSC